MKKKIPKESGEISRREFLRDAGFVVGGAAIGSTVLLAACGDGEVTTETETVTKAATVTETETVSKFVCPFDGQEFDTFDALVAHIETAHPGEVEVITKFVCPYCSEELATLAALKAHVDAEHPAEVVVEELAKLTVNGQVHELKLEPHWTLSFVLREKLGLTGTKVACDDGSCGSCTVLVDGIPVPSCMLLAIEMEGTNILTIEGLANGGTLHPIQEAWLEEHGAQCGFCTPGLIMATKALLDRNLNPTAEDVKAALAGNICICSNYEHIVKAALVAAQKMKGGS